MRVAARSRICADVGRRVDATTIAGQRRREPHVAGGDFPDEPVAFYSELERWERRKVVRFKDGHYGYASAEGESGYGLALIALPELDELSRAKIVEGLMGSVSWKTTTEFDVDIERALRRAQEETFARGEYGFTYKMTRLYRSIGKPPPALPPTPKARSIDDARKLAAEDGTCSVLDVYELGKKPAPGVAAPLTIDVNAPTKEDIENALPDLYESLGRGEAGYLVCHENGKPVSIWFIGMSFD